VVAKILTSLNETENQALAQIVAIIDVIGEKAALDCLKEAITTDERGGLLREDGARRTRGGVFFNIVRRRLSAEARTEIFQRLPRRLKKLGKTAHAGGRP